MLSGNFEYSSHHPQIIGIASIIILIFELRR
jgi:hypothetical protein